MTLSTAGTRRPNITGDMVARLLARLAENQGGSSLRFDANETGFLERELTQLRTKVYEVQYADNLAIQFVPLATDIDPDAKTYSTPVLDRTGQAKVIGNGVTDIPRVDIKKDEILGTVATLAISYAFDIFELRTAARLGIPLEMWKAQAARAAIEEGIDKMLAFGQTVSQTGLGVAGLVNNASVAVDTSSFQPWVAGTTTAAQMLTMLNKPPSALNVTVQNKGALLPDTLLMSSAYFDLASTTQISTGSDMTVLEYFKRNSPYIKNVVQWNRLATANAAGNGPRLVYYRKSPVVLEGVVPRQFEQLPPQPKGLEVVTDCLGRAGGVKLYHPEAVSYVDPT